MVLENISFDVGIPIINDVINTFLQNAESITIIALTMAIYAIVIWHYYRLLAKRDLFNPKEDESNSIVVKFFESFEFIAKYVIVFPLISFIFFGIFSLMLFLLSKDQSIQIILLTAVTVISATRITAYYNEDLSKDLAKLVPFALLGVFIVQADFFSTDLLFERIFEVPNFLVDILSFVIYFLVLEIGLRLIYSLKVAIWGKNEDKKITITLKR